MTDPTLRRAATLLAIALACAAEPPRAHPADTAAGEVAPASRQPAATSARNDAEAIVALVPGGDSAARQALVMGAAWRATAALAPSLADSARRTPTTALLAAAAAAERDDWATVDRLATPLPDSSLAGFPSLLRARSALERGDGASVALRTSLARQAYDAARRSAARAPNGGERGVRLAIAARALDRLAAADSTSTPLADSAAVAYRSAAAQLPEVADWLLLRSAEVTRDAEARGRTYAALRLAAARARSSASEATARERSGDRAGAAVAYAAAGRRTKALSLRLVGADATVRAAIRDSLVRIVTAQSGTGEARAAVELLDATFAPLTPAEELAVARSAAASGPTARAVAAYGRAIDAGLGTPRDRYAHALMLARSGGTTAANAALARLQAEGGPIAGDAAYQRARLLVRPNPAAARAALQDVADAFPTDTAAATSALYLLADLAVDDGRDADARALLLRLARSYPTSDRTPRARFDAAIIALAGGDAAAASRELDDLRAERDTAPSEEEVAATYWAGRAAQALGDAARARTRWRETVTRAPESYYALLAARRLGEAPWRPVAASGPAPADAAEIAAAVRRIALLERIGFDPEAGWERDALTRSADSSAARLAAAAVALRDAGATSAGMRLARRALDRGAPPTAELYRALYPWPWEALMRESARARGVPPELAAAVTRQESSFTPGATSAAGAVGLMQLMPPVGRSLWDALGAGRGGVAWSASLLRLPDVSIALGTRHLATSLTRASDPSYALATYNAGGTPVARWRKRPGTADPELFVERIPYDETRDYVRIVTRNRAFYESLY